MKVNSTKGSSLYFGVCIRQSKALTAYTNNLLSTNMMHTRSIKRQIDRFRAFLDLYGTEKDAVIFSVIRESVVGGKKTVNTRVHINDREFALTFTMNDALKKLKLFFSKRFEEMGIRKITDNPSPYKPFRAVA